MTAAVVTASGGLTTLFDRVRAVVQESAWTAILSRGLLFLIGLAVLAWIGRVATASTSMTTPPMAPIASASSSSPIIDAGVVMAHVPAPTPPAPPPPPRVAAAPASRARATPEDPVYLNHAGVEELRRLPGVGAKRADSIIELRQRSGRFQRVEELLKVKGIGRTMLRKWRLLIRLESPPPPADATPTAP